MKIDIMIPLQRGEHTIHLLQEKYHSPDENHVHAKNLVEVVSKFDSSILKNEGESVVIGLALSDLGFKEKPTVRDVVRKVRAVRGKFPKVNYGTLGICTYEEALLLGIGDPENFPEDKCLFVAMDPVYRRNGKQKKFTYIFKIQKKEGLLHNNLLICKYEGSRDVKLPLDSIFLFPLREVVTLKKKKSGIQDRPKRKY